MKHLEFTVLSSTKIQDVVDRLYATFGLPSEGETCRGQLAAVMPQIVDQLPELSLEGAGVEQHAPEGRTCDLSTYIVHVPFEPLEFGSRPVDDRMDLVVRGLLQRHPIESRGPEFVKVTCYCHVVVAAGQLHLEMQCTTDLVEKKMCHLTGKSFPFRYVLNSLSFINASHGLRLTGIPSPHAVAARRKRVSDLAALHAAKRQAHIESIQKLPRVEMFRYSDGLELVGEEAMDAFTYGQGLREDWIEVSDQGSDEYFVTVYRSDGHGGLRMVEICEVNLNGSANEQSLMRFFLRRRR